MNSRIIYFYLFFILTAALGLAACKKQSDFLDAKPNAALSTITTASQLQNILNDEGLFNRYADPALGLVSSDEYYVSDAIFSSENSTNQNLYIWATQIYPAEQMVEDWDNPYQEVYYANVVLDAIPVVSGSQQQLNVIKGEALFYRSIAFYNLLQTFCLPYDSTTASTTLGIPLRLTSDLNVKSVRSTEQQGYSQVIQDLTEAISLLPETSSAITSPNKVSANALLARIYLAMGSYGQALSSATATLEQDSALTDYNTLDSSNPYELVPTSTPYLNEDIYHTTMISYDFPSYEEGAVDSTLYSLYSQNDLRKTFFFAPWAGQIVFKGSYEFHQFGDYYSGLATDEIYLIRAECYARQSNVSAAMNDLNTLLIKRWRTNTFVQYTATNATDALNQILTERRKELIFRGLRWTDLRRLNQDSRFAVTLTRILGSASYSLPPNDPRYALPIPDDEISESGIQQNQR